MVPAPVKPRTGSVKLQLTRTVILSSGSPLG